MSKFRLISKTADGIALAFRLKQEGHSVDFYLKDDQAPHLYKGILDRVDSPVAGIDKDTILLIDMCFVGKEADALRKQGFRVYGGSDIADKLELDRGFGLDVAGNAGIEVPYSEDFQSFDKAIDFLEKRDEDGGWVFKPEKNKEGIATFVSSDKDEMIEMLEHYKEIWTGKVDFILQEVKEGIEVSSEVWCVNGIIVPNSYNNTFETKRFLNDDLGPNTGCQSSTVKFNALPNLYDQTFKKLEKWLKLQKYNGPLDINCIISDGVPYMLEWTARMGYNAIYALVEDIDDLGGFFAALANGEMPEIEPTDDWLGALRITIPPYPHVENAPETEGKPVRGLDATDYFSAIDFEHIWPLKSL